MSSIPYNVIAASKPFYILVGSEKKSFMMHSELLARMSKPLNRLVRGEMKEANDGAAEWPEIDEETFVRFWEFAYTGDYTAAKPEIVPASETQANHHDETAEEKKPEYYPMEVPGPEPAADPWMHLGTGRKKKSAGLFESQPPRKGRLWDRFKELKYNVPLLPPLPEELPPASRLDHSEVFLSHARIYVLADYYDIEALLMLSLKKLHQALIGFELSRNRVDDVAMVLAYCFANTVDKGREQDKLRHLLTLYVACKVEMMWPSSYFQEILERSGELSKAVIEHMLDRLD